MNKILLKIFPKNITNQYTGSKISLYTFYVITIITLWRSQHHMFAADGGAQSIATIPLNTFTESGAAAVVSTFSLWGLSQLLMGFIYLIVSIRYKTLIPLMYIFIFIEYAFRIWIGSIKPMPTLGTAPGAISNYIFLIITPILLILSMKSKKTNSK